MGWEVVAAPHWPFTYSELPDHIVLAKGVEQVRYVPERTCRNLGEPDEMIAHPFLCSECGARSTFEGEYHESQTITNDDMTLHVDSWRAWRHCPSCGAKVVN